MSTAFDPAEKAALALVFEAYASAVRALEACEKCGFTGTAVIHPLEAARDEALAAYKAITS